MNLDRQKKDFQEELKRRAFVKMALVRAAKARKRAEKEKATPQIQKPSSVSAKLDEILALLRGKSASALKFTITERDPNGEVKSFEVKG